MALMLPPGRAKKDRPFGRSFPPMSRTARKQGPEGPTPALPRYSSTFVRVCQASVFESEAGSHGTRLLGAAWLPWRVLPRSEGAPAPALDYLRPAPRYRLGSRAEGRPEYGTSSPTSLAPPLPPAGEGGGGERGRTPDKHRSCDRCTSPMGPGGGNEQAGNRGGGEPSQERAPPHRRPAPTAPPGTIPSDGPGSAGGGEGRRRTRHDKTRLRYFAAGREGGGAENGGAGGAGPRGARVCAAPAVANNAPLPQRGRGPQLARPPPGEERGPVAAPRRTRAAVRRQAPQAGAAHPERGSSPHPAAHDSLERCALHPEAPASACAQRTRTGAAAAATTPASGPERLTALWPARDSGPQRNQAAQGGAAAAKGGETGRASGRTVGGAGASPRMAAAAARAGGPRGPGPRGDPPQRGGGAPILSPPQRFRTPSTIT